MKKIYYLNLIVLTAALIISCTTTVIPVNVTHSEPSWDGTNQNSGFLYFTNHLMLLTSHKHDEYNGLIKKYSDDFIPPLKKDDGITDGIILNGEQTYLIDKQHLEYFLKMIQKNNQIK